MKHTERPLLKNRALLKPAACLTLALSALMATSAWATNIKTTTTMFGDHFTQDPATSSYGKWEVGNPTGRYLTHADHWNPSSNGSMTMTSETDPNVTPSFTVTGWTDFTNAAGALDFTQSASIYDVAKGVWSTLEGEDGNAFVDENGHNQPGHTHAPAAFASIYKGCHWGECSIGNGAPFPILVSNIATLQSTWTVGSTAGTSADTGVWDVAYDIWFDTNARGLLPGSPEQLAQKPSPVTPQELQYGQPDGAEVMIWMNNKGYNNTPITPAGMLAGTATLNVGDTMRTFDVWIARLGAADAFQWNVISYVAQNRANTFGLFDANVFVKDAKTRTCATGACISDSWWITSIQAGFEIWARGTGLKTTDFSVTPTFVGTNTAAVNSGRTGGTDGKTPLVNWVTPFMINTTGCVGGTATYSIVEAGDSTNAMPIQPALTGQMVESQPGYYSAFIGVLNPRHGDAIVTMTVTCNGISTPTVINIYIDPSGIVKNTKGEAIANATMTLYQLVSGVYTPVPNGSAIMSPYNRRNPDLSGDMGTFGWNVQPGTYKVRAEKSGCHLPGNPNQTFVESSPLVIGPEVTNLNLVLECTSTGGNNNTGVTVQLTTNGTDWDHGYCRNVVLTNTTSQPVTWKVNFDLPFPGTVTQGWNITDTQSGNTVAASGIGWNNVIQPGQVLKDQGFCATK